MTPTILWSKAKTSIKRFFVPFVWTVLLFGLFCYETFFEFEPVFDAWAYPAYQNQMFSLWTTFAFGFAMSLLATVFVEYAVSKPNIWEKFGRGLSLTPITASFLSAIVYFWAKYAGPDDMIFIMQFIGTLLVIGLLVVYFIIYNYPSNAIGKLVKQVLWGGLITGILCGGVSLLIWAVYQLIWQFPDAYKVYEVVIMLFVFIFFFNFVLAGIPKREEKEEAGKIFKAIFGYVVMPIFMILQVILAIYLIKSLIMWNFSASMFGYFIASAGCLFFGLYFLLKQFGNFDKILKISAWVQLFLIPVGIYSLVLRLHNYGCTEMRYALFALYIVLFIYAIFALIKKGEWTRHIFGILAIVVIIASVTPFNIQRATYLSQEARFIALLQKHEALNDDFSIQKVKYKTIEEYMEVYDLWNSNICYSPYLRKEWKKYKDIESHDSDIRYYDPYESFFLKKKFTDEQWEKYENARWDEELD